MTKKLILVVDDDAISRTIIKGFLKHEDDYLVKTVESTRDCLHFIMDNTVDLIICDVIMDELNGIELSRILSSRKETSEVPIILISTVDQSEIMKRSCHCHNVKKVEQKPYPRNLLLSDLENIFTSQSGQMA